MTQNESSCPSSVQLIRVELTYAVGEYSKNGLSSLAAIVDRGLVTQVTRLKAFVETGKP